jgi:hypothetical protein
MQIKKKIKKRCGKRGATILNDGIKKYFLSFLSGVLCPQFGNLIVNSPVTFHGVVVD